MDPQKIYSAVEHWVETVVIGLNLCPFAKREFINQRVRFYVSEAATTDQLLLDIQAELGRLERDNRIETTLLIHPNVLQDFSDYNQFLDEADDLLLAMKAEGVFQIASFHPDYQFADAQMDAVENYTNRSPFPLLHIIREASVERAIAHHPDPDGIPERNIALLNKLGLDKMRALLQVCVDKG